MLLVSLQAGVQNMESLDLAMFRIGCLDCARNVVAKSWYGHRMESDL